MPLDEDQPRKLSAGSNSEVEPTVEFEDSSGSNPELNEFGETDIRGPSGDTDPGSSGAGSLTEQTPTAFGKYQVLDVLGRGAFGAVYLGHDEQLNRRVAIKVPLIARDDEKSRKIQRDFLEEARRLAQLNHPGIVTVLDVALENGQCYIVSEYLEGTNLSQWMGKRKIDWPSATSIAVQLADALAYGHSQSTIHRDLKPGNIILSERAEGLSAVLVDFGLALSDSEGVKARPGMIVGTPDFMSPEQARGEGHRIDGRTDIYALGVVLYRMLCGQLPFAGDDVHQLLSRVIHEQPKPPRQLVHSVPVELEAVCLKAMSKDVDDRYTTAGDMATELRRILSQHEAEQHDSRGEPKAGESAVPGPVRRQVTVLDCQCELFESMEFLDNFDPEQQHETLHDYQAMCRELVEPLDGRIIQSTGESLLVCFGYPTAHEDAAHRAVRLGLDLIAAIQRISERLASQHGIEFDSYIGVHTGLAVLQDEEDGESFSMTGEARSVATRLEPAHEANSVVITEATHRIVQGFFESASCGQYKIKGASKKLEVFLVKGEGKARSRLDVAESSALAPMVGRDTELDVLLELWQEAADGIGQVVCLIGEAGLGKSRLVRAVRDQVAAMAEAGEMPVIEWRCSPFYQNTGFYPAIDYFERLLDFERESSVTKRLEKLEDYFARFDMGDSESISLFAAMLSVPTEGRLPALQLSPVRQREKTQEALLQYVARYAERQPLLFVVEDLHWVDATTLEWLAQLLDNVPDARALTLLTFRPEFETPWGSRGHQTQVALNRLTQHQMGEMVLERLGVREVPKRIHEWLSDRTEGVPLFIEEFCNVIRESEALTEVDGSLRLADDFDLDAIPSTLQDLLASRLDRLQSQHDIAHIGATIGREFSHRMIGAVTGLPDAVLEEELNKLAVAEVVYRAGTPPQAVYTFKHALIQAAAYDSLLRKKRQQYHQRIAEVLETEFPESVEAEPELLAHHFTEAGQTRQAIPYWQKAGHRAQVRFANAEAIEHFQRGLALLLTLDESAERDQLELDFQVPLATVMTMARGWAAPEVESVHLRARELCESIGGEAPEFHVTWGMWAWRLLRAELDMAADLAGDVRRLADSQDDPSYYVEACFALECTSLFRGELRQCLEHSESGMEQYDRERGRFHASITGQNAGCTIQAHWAWGSWIAGYPDRALTIGRRGVALGRELEDPFSHAFALYHLGCVHQHCRRGRDAIKCGEKSIAIGKEQGFGIWVALGTLCLGSGLVLEGKRIDDGVELVKQGVEAFRGSGAELSLTHYFAALAEAYQAADRPEDAKRAVEDGLELAERSNERFHEANLYRLKGELLLAGSDSNRDAAGESYQNAIDIARRQGAKSWELRVAMSMARLWQEEGRREEARQLLADVYGWFIEGFETPDLTEAQEMLAGLGQTGR